SNTDALLTYNDQLSRAVTMTASVGGNLMHGQSKENNAMARGLMLPGIYKLSNALEQGVVDNIIAERRTHSLYGLVNFSWKELIFLDVTGRNDWSSTLPEQNRSYFYPSVSTSYILSDIFRLPTAISFAKARLSWAQVGTDTYPYRIAK